MEKLGICNCMGNSFCGLVGAHSGLRGARAAVAGGGRLRCASRAWGCLSRSCLPPLLPLRRWAKITWPSAGFLLLLLRFPILQPKWRRAPEGLERTQGETQSCRLKLQRTARSGVARCFSRAVLVLRRPCNWKLESGLKEEGNSKEPSSLLTAPWVRVHRFCPRIPVSLIDA